MVTSADYRTSLRMYPLTLEGLDRAMRELVR